MVVLAGTTTPVGTGLGSAFSVAITRNVLAAVVLQGMLLAVLTGFAGVAMVVASTATVWLARMWFLRRLGGVNGDCLGATCQAVETVNLVILAWRHSS